MKLREPSFRPPSSDYRSPDFQPRLAIAQNFAFVRVVLFVFPQQIVFCQIRKTRLAARDCVQTLFLPPKSVYRRFFQFKCFIY